MTTFAVILAAGQGRRAGGQEAKQWRMLDGKTVLDHCVETMLSHPAIDGAVLVLPEGALSRAKPHLSSSVWAVAGGESRDASVRNALESLASAGVERVLIHDGARPLLTHGLIDRLIAALDAGAAAAAPGLTVTDALWRGADGLVAGTLPRDGLFRAQTPQAFAFPAILAAHRAHPGPAADDVEVARAAGLDVVIVEGEEDNLKITHPADFDRAERLIRAQRDKGMDIRLGNGFDVHRFRDGDGVTLCGVTVPFEKSLEGHSDADVGMHALTDAIYGALAEGDIGRHFPPSDPQWKGAASEIFLAHAAGLVRDRGFAISNADVTLICERPKVGPHAAAMQTELARILGIAPDRVSVKATTSERLGFTGREEGIAAIATATLVKP